MLDLPPKWKDVGSQCWICHRSAMTLVVRDTDSRLAYLGRIEDTRHKDSALPPTDQGRSSGRLLSLWVHSVTGDTGVIA